MSTISHRAGILTEVFIDEELAQAAVKELKSVGFRESQIEVALVGSAILEEEQKKEALELIMSRTVAGFGIGALVGLGMIVGVIPAIAAGTIGLLISSVATAATIAVASVLIDVWGNRENFSDYHKSDLAVVTVKAGSREEIASSVFNRFNRRELTRLQAT